MSKYLSKFNCGYEALDVAVESVRILNKNTGNKTGSRYKKWEETLLGEVLLRVNGDVELSTDLLEDEWVKDPVFKFKMKIKTFMHWKDLYQEQLMVLPIDNGLDKPGFLKESYDIRYITDASPMRGEKIDSMGTRDGLSYMAPALRGAAKAALWFKLGYVITQKEGDVDNRYMHKRDNEKAEKTCSYEWDFPSCGKCMNRVYEQPPERAVSDNSAEARNFCAMTGEEVDIGAEELKSELNRRDHGLLHNMKGHMFLYGDKVVTGGRADDDGAYASVSVGRKSVRAGDLRDSEYEYLADRCPFYSPKRVLPERGLWKADLSMVYLPKVVLDMSGELDKRLK